MYIDLRPINYILMIGIISNMVVFAQAKLSLNVVEPVLNEFNDAESGAT